MIFLKHNIESEMTQAPAVDRVDLNMSDLLIRTLLALEVAYQYSPDMPDHVRNFIKNRIDEARMFL